MPTPSTFEAFGERKTLKGWASDPRCQVHLETLRRRVRSGKTVEESLQGSNPILLTAFGEERTAYEWARDSRCAVSEAVLYRRLQEGWDSEEALTTRPRQAKTFEALGEVKPLSEWIKDSRCAVSRDVLYSRLRKGWEFQEALTIPTAETVSIFGEFKTVAEWAKDQRSNVDADTLRGRLSRGWDAEEALTEAKKQLLEFEAFGETKTLKEWIKDPRSIVKESVVRDRLGRHWDFERAITAPLEVEARFEAFGETKTLREWSADPRCIPSLKTLSLRIYNGLPFEEALTKELGRRRGSFEAFGEKRTLAGWAEDSRCVVSLTTLASRVHEYGWNLEAAITTPIGGGSSVREQELAEYVSSLVETVVNDRTAIGPMELDILVPSKGIAIEFNGIYWHSERFVGKTYHAEKLKACTEADLRLIQIWEDEWLHRRPQVESMLVHKLGLSKASVGARKCSVVGVQPMEATEFLRQNHIQGAPPSIGRAWGLKHRDSLVAVMLFARNPSKPGDFLLTRYATSVTIPGGFSKLLRAAERELEATSITSFADLCVSDGGLYEANGFELEATLDPDYKYVVGDQRVHKFNYRLKRFKEDPDLLFEEGLTERELANLNGLHRIYDAGKLRYRKSL